MVRKLAFGTLLLMIVVLIGATIIELYYGSDVAHDHVYTAPLTLAGWGLLGVSALYYIVQRRKNMGIATLLLHLAFVVIGMGAIVTHFTARQGSIHLRMNEAAQHTYIDSHHATAQLPFEVALHDFAISYYPGTQSPMDYISTLRLSDDTTRCVSMNRIVRYQGYRFYPSTYDSDLQGATLLIAYDPYGIGITYTGYGLLLLSMCLFFFQRRSLYRSLRLVPLAGLLCFCTVTQVHSASHVPTPHTVSSEVAASMGDIYIYYNGRICPLESFAHDFLLKLSGKTSYKGLSAVQVVAGWLFYYDDWKAEPLCRIKDAETRRRLGIDGSRASLQDFFTTSGYRLEQIDSKGAAAANEQLNLISTVATGAALTIYPITSTTWYSPTDKLPTTLDEQQWIFIRKSLNLIAQHLYEGKDDEVIDLFRQIKRYQQKVVGRENLPSDVRFRAEKLYNRLPSATLAAMVLLLLGCMAYGIVLRQLLHPTSVRYTCLGHIGTLLALCYVTMLLVVRAVASNHLPLSNGFEVMQLLAWCALLMSLFMRRHLGLFATAGGFLIAGFAMLVAGMGESNPAITALMPVLHSPLLCIHVAVIMISYALLMSIALNGVTALLLHRRSEVVRRLRTVSNLMLYPALFLLAGGIFVGAIWANQSWGCYWSWDPKETWALITLFVYAIPLHQTSLVIFRRDCFFHGYVTCAFLAVLITYFGVNYLLGGMHSYAG